MSALPVTRREASLVDGEFPLTAADFRALAEVLYATSGIHLPDSKAALVYSRLAKRLRALGLRSFKEYVSLVRSPEGKDECERLLMALTTNVTRFFREPHHFDHLIETVLAPNAERVKAGGSLRLWSSACSTGQEPYSLALAVLSVWPNAADLDVRILATDIDENVVNTARAGVYTSEAIEQIPVAYRNRWLAKDPDTARTWRMGAEARSLIAFNTLNLIGEWPMKRKFDAIFCRNVVIYFDEPTQAKLWVRFRERLAAKGRLYVGHSERVGDTSFESDGQTVYRLAGGAK
ncbi:putative chemotaxis protein methyltransferase [uncultured Defluviicoccus sp.]|uniref:protein-glutamate O-methyltransferase n=1 Tax=metagenome TaxID=256318 RepID=A0A380T8F0_9ZZZZ|nr:putative chemotaxis protein methyltransferase [uncultured Defluviicoccus sp.]